MWCGIRVLCYAVVMRTGGGAVRAAMAAEDGVRPIPRLHLNLSIPRQPTIQSTLELTGSNGGTPGTASVAASVLPPPPQPPGIRALFPPVPSAPIAPSEKEKTRNLIQSDILNTIAFGKLDAASMAAANHAAVAAATANAAAAASAAAASASASAAGTGTGAGTGTTGTASTAAGVNGTANGTANGNTNTNGAANGTEPKRRSRGEIPAVDGSGATASDGKISVAGGSGAATIAVAKPNANINGLGANGSATPMGITGSSGVVSAAGGSVLAYFTRQSSTISVTTVRDLGRFDRLRTSKENIARLRAWFNTTYDPATASFAATTATDLGVITPPPAAPTPSANANNPSHGRLLARTDSNAAANGVPALRVTLNSYHSSTAIAPIIAPPAAARDVPLSPQQIWSAQQTAGLALLDPTTALGWGAAAAPTTPLMDAYQFVVLMSKATHCSEYQLLQLFELFGTADPLPPSSLPVDLYSLHISFSRGVKTESRVISVTSSNPFGYEHNTSGAGFSWNTGGNSPVASSSISGSSNGAHGPTSTGLGGLVFDDWFLVLLLFVAADCFQAHKFLYAACDIASRLYGWVELTLCCWVLFRVGQHSVLE